jgi:hypothetical protein
VDGLLAKASTKEWRPVEQPAEQGDRNGYRVAPGDGSIPSVPTPAGITEEQLAEIEARANAATPGPWRESASCGLVSDHPHVTRDVWSIPKLDGDMPFIAAARTDVPALVAEVRRLRKADTLRLGEVLGLTERIAQMESDCCTHPQCSIALDEARAEFAEVLRERDADIAVSVEIATHELRAELRRWQTGQQIEGDYVTQMEAQLLAERDEAHAKYKTVSELLDAVGADNQQLRDTLARVVELMKLTQAHEFLTVGIQEQFSAFLAEHGGAEVKR